MTVVGKTYGNIRIVEAIGKGGMGDVFLGLDEVLRRKVAVKSIRGIYRLNARAKARFLREAQVLSQLEHPNICQIHGFVEQEDEDLLILEYIRGQDLKESLDWIRDTGGLKVQLRIAQQIAEVLVAAHEKGVIHRDLKPENIMITNENQVKVLDFGLSGVIAAQSAPDAALTLERKQFSPVTGNGSDSLCEVPWETKESNGLDRTVDLPSRQGNGSADSSEVTQVNLSDEGITEYGSVLGTPRFMSPEQARGEPLAASTDMYSLGLVLQWFFTGKPPYPPNLSKMATLHWAASGKTLPTEKIDKDLKTLIDRLESLNPDIRPTALETLTRIKWILGKPGRRLKGIAISAVVIALTVGSILSTVGFYRATQERSRAIASEARALEEARTSKQTVELLQQFLSSADPARKGKDLTVVELLSAFEPEVDGLHERPAIQASLYQTYGNTYKGLGLWEPAHAFTKKGLELRMETLGEDHPDTLVSLISLADIVRMRGDYEGAEELLRTAIERCKKVLGADHPQTLKATSKHAWCLSLQGSLEKAESQGREALREQKRVLGREHPETLNSMQNLAIIWIRQEKVEQAETLLRETVETSTHVLGEDDPFTLGSKGHLATCLSIVGQHEESGLLREEILSSQRRILGDKHPDTIGSMHNLALNFSRQGDYEQAEALFRDVLAIGTEVLGENHPAAIMAMNSLASCLVLQGKNKEAETVYRTVMKKAGRLMGKGQPQLLDAMAALESLLRKANRDNEADGLMSQILELEVRPETPSRGP